MRIVLVLYTFYLVLYDTQYWNKQNGMSIIKLYNASKNKLMVEKIIKTCF